MLPVNIPQLWLKPFYAANYEWNPYPKESLGWFPRWRKEGRQSRRHMDRYTKEQICIYI